jgi:hypothetical protein
MMTPHLGPIATDPVSRESSCVPAATNCETEYLDGARSPSALLPEAAPLIFDFGRVHLDSGRHHVPSEGDRFVECHPECDRFIKAQVGLSVVFPAPAVHVHSDRWQGSSVRLRSGRVG